VAAAGDRPATGTGASAPVGAVSTGGGVEVIGLAV
jgi:hypothetical protein